MKANRDHSFRDVRLLESDPSAYFEKLLQELNEIEDWIDNRDDEARPLRVSSAGKEQNGERGCEVSRRTPHGKRR